MDYLSTIGFIGYGLQKLTRGNTLHMHLRTIKFSLQEHRCVEISTSVPGSNEGERDEELEAVQPQASRTTDTGELQPQVVLHTSYMEWLKLMLIHFDTVDILSRHINTLWFQCEAINVRILVSPPVSSDMLDWRKLFTDAKFSTIFSTKNMPVHDLPFTNNKVYKFLDQAVKSNLDESSGLAKGIRKLWMALQVPNKLHKLEPIRGLVSQLMQPTVPGWRECAEELQILLQDDQALNSDVKPQIGDAIELLFNSNNLHFFNTLHEANKKSLSFRGSMHCKAVLASLLMHSKDGMINEKYEDIRAQLRVGYAISNMFLSSDPFFP